MAKVIRLKNQKPKPKYKYAINDQVNGLPRDMRIDQVIEHLATFGVTRNNFYWDREIPYGSEKSMSADRLLIYCKVFDCSIDDLLNHEVKATSIRQAYGKRISTALK